MLQSNFVYMQWVRGIFKFTPKWWNFFILGAFISPFLIIFPLFSSSPGTPGENGLTGDVGHTGKMGPPGETGESIHPSALLCTQTSFTVFTHSSWRKLKYIGRTCKPSTVRSGFKPGTFFFSFLFFWLQHFKPAQKSRFML